MNLRDAKTMLRRDLRRRAKAAAERRDSAADEGVVAGVRRIPEWDAARQAGILAFAPMAGEPDATALVREVLAAGGRAAFPKFEPGSDVYRPVWVADLDDGMAPGHFGIREPVGHDLALPDSIALALLPGLGFDRAGRRIGRGRGYIDELCAWLGRTVARVGLAYSRQLVGDVPAGPGDALMDWVVTERETIRVVPARAVAARGPR